MAFATGCGGGGATTPPGPDGGHVEGSVVLGIGVTPMPLTPLFQRDVHDYYVRCNPGDNPATVKVLDDKGWESLDVDLTEDQLVNVRDQYYIRCLPHDFPEMTATRHREVGEPTPGWYLVNGGAYAMVLDTNGTPVWYERGTEAIDVDAPAPNVMTYMLNGTAPFGFDPASEFHVRDLSAGTTSVFKTVGSPTDGHDFRPLPNGDYMMLTYPIDAHVDLTGLQTLGSDETVAGCEIQEIDPNGTLVWSWRARDHVDPVQESLRPSSLPVNGTTVVDPYHCNSMDVDASGNILLSIRHASTLLYIDRSTGTVQWKLGGATFSKDGAQYITVVGDSEGEFSMEHDARMLPNGNVTMFDNHGAGTDPDGVARCIEYAVDHNTNQATPVWQVLGSGVSKYEGSCRPQADGHVVVSWGFVPGDPRVVSEFDADGNDVLDVEFPEGPSYRAVKVAPSQLDIDLLRAMTVSENR